MDWLETDQRFMPIQYTFQPDLVLWPVRKRIICFWLKIMSIKNVSNVQLDFVSSRFFAHVIHSLLWTFADPLINISAHPALNPTAFILSLSKTVALYKFVLVIVSFYILFIAIYLFCIYVLDSSSHLLYCILFYIYFLYVPGQIPCKCKLTLVINLMLILIYRATRGRLRHFAFPLMEAAPLTRTYRLP